MRVQKIERGERRGIRKKREYRRERGRGERGSGKRANIEFGHDYVSEINDDN